jgi:hypothetical protein
MEKEFISSIGLKSGEKNSIPQESTGDNWKDVDWFLHTWGFLPNDESAINKLSKDGRNRVNLILLDLAWRSDNEYRTKGIEMIQEIFEKEKISDYFKE